MKPSVPATTVALMARQCGVCTRLKRMPGWRVDLVRAAALLFCIVMPGLSRAQAVPVVQPLGCLIEPSRLIDVGTPVIGVVRELRVDRGSAVRKGDVLAVLKADVEVAQLSAASNRARAEADLMAARKAKELATRKRERTQDLHAQSFVSIQALEQSIGEEQLAEARVAQAREQKHHASREAEVSSAHLSARTIRAPIGGVVVERFVNEGERVDERPLLRIAVLDPLRAEVVLPSALFGKISRGSGSVVIPDLAGLTAARGRVDVVDRVIDPASNTFRVRIEVPNKDGRLPAGLRCKVEFDDIAPAKPAAPSSSSSSASGSSAAAASLLGGAATPHESDPQLKNQASRATRVATVVR